MARYKLLLVILTILSGNVPKSFCANILITEDLPSKSHQIWNYVVADALVAKGHNVTVLGPKSISTERHERFHSIVLEGLTKSVATLFTPDELTKVGVIDNILLINNFAVFACNYSVNTEGFKFLMNYPKDFKFDLILSDVTLSNCLLPISQRFNFPPTAALTAFMLPPHVSEAFGNPYPLSYLPYDLLNFSDQMNFFERLQNYALARMDTFLKYIYFEHKIEEVARSAFGNDMRPLEDFANRLSLLICNLTPGFHYPRPITPNIIPVGGLHINPKKKLPQDLQQIMDDSKNGVILFALGSNLRSDSLAPEKKIAILEVFGQLNQTVLWKFESQLTNVPKNVIIRKWLPQTEILAHPNMKLFVSHGGALSTTEAAYFGVPIIGMPFFVDQRFNIELVVSKKLGVKLEYSALTKESFLSSIQEILGNSRYSVEIKKLSEQLRDQTEPAINRAVFWIEFLMRHNGTHIFDPKSRHLSNFVLSSTDVLLFLSVLACLLTYICYKVLFLVLRRLCYDCRKIKKE
nr:UDP-glucuronosyltransferase 2B15-like [Leptinotarsa decemlineata]